MSNADDDPRYTRRLREGEALQIGPAVLTVLEIQRSAVTLQLDVPGDMPVQPLRPETEGDSNG